MFAELNFFLVIQPFATWYIPIVWYGYILFVDSIIYKIKKKSLISTYPRELLLMMALSLPFWLIFEFYNLFTLTWTYSNYTWYVHLADFTVIMPALLITFMLLSALNIGKGLDAKTKTKPSKPPSRLWLLVLFGAFVSVLPIMITNTGYFVMWLGLLLFFEPLNFLMKRTSLLQKATAGERSPIARLLLSGLIVGLLLEFWNYQAYPKWSYNIPYLLPGLHLFAMPILGYIGYLTFAAEAYVFYIFFRGFFFRYENKLLEINGASDAKHKYQSQ